MSDNAQLQEIFDNDMIGDLISKAQRAEQKAREEFEDILTPVEKILSELTQKQKEKLSKLGKAINEEDISKAAKIIGIEYQPLNDYVEKNKEVSKAISDIIDYDDLQKTWEKLLPESPITVIDKDAFRGLKKEEPYIVFYSATWCNPCKLWKPMYAQLAPLFEKAQLFFTEDEELAKEEGVGGYPTIVAYFPGVNKVKTSLPLSAEELWKVLNTLVDAGKSFSGSGTLKCTDTECKIEPW